MTRPALYSPEWFDAFAWKGFLRMWATISLCEAFKASLIDLVECEVREVRAQHAHSLAAVIGSLWASRSEP